MKKVFAINISDFRYGESTVEDIKLWFDGDNKFTLGSVEELTYDVSAVATDSDFLIFSVSDDENENDQTVVQLDKVGFYADVLKGKYKD